ncbi:TPA: formyltetrahydrofolate deformylase, partial [Pseudomonas aeruginosa]|nr:formyltetrahydrofolate deformylase [Pseudomonas aeruginosa]HEJ6181667.1 formyltetrahydrofolate deformylase [Pseudomonas aeruginosa]
MDTHYILTIDCPARSGIVAVVSTYLVGRQCYISELSQFDDEITGRFFMRAVFRFDTGVHGDIQALRDGFEDIAVPFDMHWQLHDGN